MINSIHLAKPDSALITGEALKVVRFSHSAGVSAYRERERQLVNQFNVDLSLVMPERWEHLGGTSLSTQREEPFDVTLAKTIGTGSVPLFAYDPITIARVLASQKPDLIDIHEEPYSVSCFEIVCLAQKYCPNAARVFYSAQNIHKKYPQPFASMEAYVYKTSDGAYPCSQSVNAVLKEKGFKANSQVIPLGIDPSIFFEQTTDRAPFGLEPENFVIGYFGRLEQCKGIQYLIEALALLPALSEARLLLVGNGVYEKELRSLAQSYQLTGRIIWAGEVQSEAIAKYLGLCDVTVVPSVTTKTWKEQFGRAVVESLACGVPAVVSDSGSLPEVVGNAGIVVPECDASALAYAIQAIAADERRRRELKANGLRLVAEKYTWRRVAEQMYELYTAAINNRNYTHK